MNCLQFYTEGPVSDTVAPPDFHGMCPLAFPFGGFLLGALWVHSRGMRKNPFFSAQGSLRELLRGVRSRPQNDPREARALPPTPHAEVVVVRSRTGQPAGAWPGLLGARATGRSPGPRSL